MSHSTASHIKKVLHNSDYDDSEFELFAGNLII